MIREYINGLMNENDEKLNNLDHQLKEQTEKLNCAQEWLESLQAEANADKNIFSPRSDNNDLKGKIVDVQKHIDKVKQEIDYIKSFMETYFAKKREYDGLLKELDGICETKTSTELEEESDEMLQERRPDNIYKELFEKTELCLDLLYSDRTRCKKELKTMKSMIQNMVDSINEG